MIVGVKVIQNNMNCASIAVVFTDSFDELCENRSRGIRTPVPFGTRVFKIVV
jgi:hypothetical protein